MLPKLPNLTGLTNKTSKLTEQDRLELLLQMPDKEKYLGHFMDSKFAESGWIGDLDTSLHLDYVLSLGIMEGASDIHLSPNQEICFTINKDIVKQDYLDIPTSVIMNELDMSILSHVQRASFSKDADFDFSYQIRFGPFVNRRFRANIGKTFGDTFLVFRTINDKIPTPESIEVPQEILDWSRMNNGLFLIAGATGSGKSTTLASVIHDIQLKEPKKIITIEKPIEYIYPTDTGRGLVIQRDVGGNSDTNSFYNGLTFALRQNPDIILIGEVRNKEEIEELIRAAETGHLSISTIHTNSVATTFNRIFSMFPSDDQRRLRSTLADTLRGVANQILVRKADGSGMFAIRETLTINDQIREYILNGDIKSIRQYLIENNRTMEQQLTRATREGRCTLEEARSMAPDTSFFDSLIKQEEL